MIERVVCSQCEKVGRTPEKINANICTIPCALCFNRYWIHPSLAGAYLLLYADDFPNSSDLSALRETLGV